MKLKVAIIGCGSIAEFRHAPEYAANPAVEIAAFCDPTPGRAARLAEKHGGFACMDIDEALAAPGINAVSVCTSNSSHAEVAIKALCSGKHVLCEKPIATSLPDAVAMIRAAERHGRTLMIGHNQRLAGAHVKAAELLKSGALGRVLTFKTTFGHGGPETWSADKGAATWFFRRSAAALGALGDLGVHKADLLRYLLDDEIDEVYAVTGTLHKKYETGEPIDVEDNAVCVLKSRRGAMGTLSASWTYYGEEDNSTVLYCEKGILRIYASKEHPLFVERRDGTVEYIDAGAMQTNASQTCTGIINAFVSAVLKGEKPSVTGEDGYEALSIALACSQSARLGGPVRVAHLRAAREPALRLPKKPHVAFAVYHLQMETNLIPERPAQAPGGRYCDDTYPSFTERRERKPVDGYWQRQVGLELGNRKIN